ncbi:alkaline phosphatase family protein [Deinococcus radiomollis]|uniref:alkaline phosphatase family protein n=1 Tax=Deinococcus radiomollis TaxID=468916 RepID=UPI003892C06A
MPRSHPLPPTALPTAALVLTATLALALSVAVLSPAGASTAPVQKPGAQPSQTLSHVFVIVLENHSLKDTLGNASMPAINRLARTYGYAANYTGVAHPSLPNYVAMIAGSTMNFTSDDPAPRFAGDNLALQLSRAGLSWRGYMQALPKAGSLAPYAGTYGKKHNPFMLSSDLLADPAQVLNVRTLTDLGPDLDAGHAPSFSFIVPDVCNDMHGAPECRSRSQLDRAGDAFVDTWTKRIMASPSWKTGSAIVVTFDEGGGGDTQGGGGRIATIVVAQGGPKGVVSQGTYNHYSLLRTLEEGFGLPLLRGAKTAAPMNDLFWKAGAK